MTPISVHLIHDVQVDRALAERGQHLGLVGMGDEESGTRIDDMKEQIEVSMRTYEGYT